MPQSKRWGCPIWVPCGESWTHRAPAASTGACLLSSLSLLSFLLPLSHATATLPRSQPVAEAGDGEKHSTWSREGELVPSCVWSSHLIWLVGDIALVPEGFLHVHFDLGLMLYSLASWPQQKNNRSVTV